MKISLILYSYLLLLLSYNLINCLQTYYIGNFIIIIEIDILKIQINNILNKQKILLLTDINKPFLYLGNSSVLSEPIVDGNYQLYEQILWKSNEQTIDTILYEDGNSRLNIYGKIKNGYWLADYILSFSLSTHSNNQLYFVIDILQSSKDYNRIFFNYKTNVNETFHGFGESFTDFNLKGKCIPILVSEQGVGRGLQPITDALNNDKEGVGGHWFTTYAPKPLYMTNQNRSMIFENSEVMYINLTNPELVEIEVWSLELRGNIVYGDTMRDLLSEITLYTGRMLPPPEWSQLGAIVGLEGGTDMVTSIVELMNSYNIPLAGIWLQDWVGLRHSYDGDRLIWNWEVNPEWYPGWNDMVSLWETRGTKVLTYLNPFFSDPSNFTNSSRHNFYQEGLDNGYFVMNSSSQPYKMHSLSIEFCMLDLTNPYAIDWMKNIIKKYSIEEAFSSGWMADFGEYLPFDAQLYSGIPAAEYHNIYPQDWAKLNMEVLIESNLSDEILFFMRSAWMKSPKYNSIFWEGDQLVSWDKYDGLKNVILGALSSGLSGHTITHSDIGGYNINFDYGYVRDEELLSRWSELSAFGAGLFRTHIGSTTDTRNFQVYDSDSSLKHFKKFSDIYRQLRDYRKVLINEAVNNGLPLIRPYALNYAYDLNSWNIETAYLFGDEFLVAPTLDPKTNNVTIYFPINSGNWIHLWGGNLVTSISNGKSLIVPAGLGFPCVFYKQSSNYGQNLRNYLIREGYTQGYSWNYNESKEKKSNDSKLSNLLLGVIISLSLLAIILFSVAIYWKSRNSLESNTSEYHSLYHPNLETDQENDNTSDSHGMSLKGGGLSHETMILVESLNN